MKYILSLAFIFLNLIATSQDLIRQNGKPDIKCKVVEIGDINIKYKKYENLTGPDYTIKTALVKDIVFENGEVETLGKSAQEKTSSSVNIEAKLAAIPRFTKAQWERCALKIKVSNEDEKAGINSAWVEEWLELKKYAYYKFPNFQMKDRNNQNVIMQEYINKMKKFPNKPTIVITYLTAGWGPFSVIDSLLNANIQEEYNVVLLGMNYNSEVCDLKNWLHWMKENKPRYLANSLLFDNNNEANIMIVGVPSSYFLDQTNNIRFYIKGGISLSEVKELLEGVSQMNAQQVIGQSERVLTSVIEGQRNYILDRKVLGNKNILIKKTYLKEDGSHGDSVDYLYEVNNEGFLVPPYKK